MRTVEDLLAEMPERLGDDFRVVLYSDGGGKGPLALIMRRPDEEYPSVVSEANGASVSEAFEAAICAAEKKLSEK